MQLQSLLARNRVEEKLASLFVFQVSGRIADILRHIVSPFLIEFGQPLEFLLELGVIIRSILVLDRTDFFFQYRIGLKLLLNDVPEFQCRSLQYLKTLLQLRCEHLLHRQILELMDPRASHTNFVISSNVYSKRAVPRLQQCRMRELKMQAPANTINICFAKC